MTIKLAPPGEAVRLQALALALDRASSSDRIFFERFPERRHRVRLASPTEVMQFEIIHEGPAQLPPGCWLHVVVQKFARGRRLRVFFPCPYAAPDEEQLAREIFQILTAKLLRGSLEAWLGRDAESRA